MPAVQFLKTVQGPQSPFAALFKALFEALFLALK